MPRISNAKGGELSIDFTDRGMTVTLHGKDGASVTEEFLWGKTVVFMADTLDAYRDGEKQEWTRKHATTSES